MSYSKPDDVRLLIAHSLDSDDVDRIIQGADADLDDRLGSYTMSTDLKKQCSSRLAAITIAERIPSSYTVGSARVSHGDRVKRWRAKVNELVRRATGGVLQVVASGYQKIDEDVRYPE